MRLEGRLSGTRRQELRISAMQLSSPPSKVSNLQQETTCVLCRNVQPKGLYLTDGVPRQTQAGLLPCCPARKRVWGGSGGSSRERLSNTIADVGALDCLTRSTLFSGVGIPSFPLFLYTSLVPLSDRKSVV